MEKTVTYSLTDVTIYPDRARVACRGSAFISPEIDTLIFDNLPLSLETESVRVSGTGAVPVRILAVDVARQHHERSPSERVQALEAQIDAVSEDILAVEDELATWQAESDQLQGLREATAEYARGLSRGRMTIEEQNDLLIYLRKQERAVRKEQRALQTQITELEKKREKLERDLAEYRSARPRSRYQVHVSVAAEGEGDFIPVLTYVVRNAQWRPIYDLHFSESDESANGLQISTQAQVSQRTGQDWTNVHLQVSTARPALNQRLPELEPWYIDAYGPPPPAPVLASKRAGGERFQLAMDAAPDALNERAASEEFVAEMAGAMIQSEQAVVTFRIEGENTVESDGAQHKYLLSRVSPAVDLNYLSIPKHTDAVFRRLKTTNESGTPMLSGSASLFFNDEYIGKTQLPYTPPDDEIELLLGVEERIEVTRELTRRDVDKKLFKDRREISYGYEIKLKNFLDDTAYIELRDQLPVSRHEEIRVELGDTRPKPAEHTELNILEWNLAIESQEEVIVQFAYSVQYPRSMQVSGLQD